MRCNGVWKVHYQLNSCALKYLMREEGGTGEKDDLVALAEAVGCGKQLPLGGMEYRAVREWVRGVLGRGVKGTDSQPAAGGDAVSQLIWRVIAEAENEVALETVAMGDAAMETDKSPEQHEIAKTTETSDAPPTNDGLLEQCLYGVAVCSVRCPAYYKSLYRLASTLHSLGHSQVVPPV